MPKRSQHIQEYRGDKYERKVKVSDEQIRERDEAMICSGTCRNCKRVFMIGCQLSN